MRLLKRYLIKEALYAVLACSFLWGNATAFAGARKSSEDSKPGKSKTRNIVVLISDGCGFNHVAAAGLYQHGKTGAQIYESFPVSIAMSTYAADQEYDPDRAWKKFDYVSSRCTDSAAAATAISTGFKTYLGAIGVGIDKLPLLHLLERAEQIGKATGVVTSVQLSHATPAGFVAHNESRGNYEQIAKEMIYESAVDLIMGCGHPWFDADGDSLSTACSFEVVGGKTTWNELVAGTAGGDADGDGIADPWKLIQTRREFQQLISGPTPKRVIGVAQVAATLQQSRSGNKFAEPYVVPLIETVPTIEEMTKAALNVLDDDPDGFFLMIEAGGAVDWASHPNQPGRMIEEQIAFDKSVEAVVEWVENNSNWHETLVIVTSDHECGYLTGPGSGQTTEGPVWNPLLNNGAGKAPGMEWHSSGHTNSLVPLIRQRSRRKTAADTHQKC